MDLIPTEKKNTQFVLCYALVFLGLQAIDLAVLFLVKCRPRPNVPWKNELPKIKTVSTIVMSRPEGKRKRSLAKSSV